MNEMPPAPQEKPAPLEETLDEQLELIEEILPILKEAYPPSAEEHLGYILGPVMHDGVMSNLGVDKIMWALKDAGRTDIEEYQIHKIAETLGKKWAEDIGYTVKK